METISLFWRENPKNPAGERCLCTVGNRAAFFWRADILLARGCGAAERSHARSDARNQQEVKVKLLAVSLK